MLDIQGRKYASVTVCDVTLYDLITHYPVMYFDTLKVNTFEGTAEVTDIQGGQGNPTLASVSHTREINVQFDDAIMTMSSLAVLTGGELRHGTDENKIVMMESELIHVADGDVSIVLSRNARKGSYVYMAEMQDGILSTATRTIDPLGEETNTISISDFYNAREEFKAATLRVFYEYEKGFPTKTEDLSEVTVLADKFAGTYKFIGDTVLFNQYTGLNDVFQIEIPRLKLDSSFSFTFNAATEAAVFSFKGKALRDDEGQMIKFRQLRAEGGADDAGNGNDQWDGQYRQIPAEIVTIDPVTRDINGTGEFYPVSW